MRIGIFDSGVGGLTVLRELLRELCGVDYLYLGDTARAPYGPKSKETIVRYSKECGYFLYQHKIDILVVACNTASSYALPALIEEFKIPVFGTVDAAAREALLDNSRLIGVIGTEATINSKSYETELKKLSPDVTVLTRACPLFVPLVEEGMFDGEIVEHIADHYLSYFKGTSLDSLILGCTHYPLLSDVIQRKLGNDVRLVSCGQSLARAIKASPNVVLNSSTENGEFYVTDDPAGFRRIAERIFPGCDIFPLMVNI